MTREERGLRGVVEQRLDVGLVGLAVEGLAVVAAVGGVVVDELDVRVGGRRAMVAAASAEADRDDGVATLGDQAVDVGGVVVLAVGLDGLEVGAELGSGPPSHPRS